MRGTPGNNQVDRLNYLIGLLSGNGSSGGRQNWTNVAFFVDPSNSTGTASDTNTGLSSSHAILTTDEFNRRIFNKTIAVPVATVTYVSDDTSGTLLDLSTVFVPTGNELVFQGTPQITHTGGALNVGTVAINPTAALGGQSQTAHTTDVADFTPFVFNAIPFGNGTSVHPQILVDTTGGNAGTSAWVVSTGGGDDAFVNSTPDLSRPVTPTFTAGTLTIGDSYHIQRGSLLAVAGAASTLGATSFFFDTQTNVTFLDFAFTATHVGANGCTYRRCSWDGPMLVGGTLTHCYVGQDITELALPMGSVNLDSGVLITAFGAGEVVAPFNFSGDPYITGSGFDVGEDAYAAPFIAPGIGSGIQIRRMPNVGMHVRQGIYELGSDEIGTALVWGKSNGIGVLISASAAITMSASLPPTVTGIAGDFAFQIQNTDAVMHVGRAFDDTTGEYTEIGGVATRATTWAHLVAAIGAGGFNFNAHWPATNAHIILA